MTLIVKTGFNGMTDADAIAYVNAVEAADGQLLEFGVGKAINDFVVGCKLDNIWPAIKASCILAGARTLTGALVPLVGTAPTNVGGLFVSGDYNRETGLVGDGSTKYLDSTYTLPSANNNNHHLSVYISIVGTGGGRFNGADTGGSNFLQILNNGSGILQGTSLSNTSSLGSALATGIAGLSRSSSSQFTFRSSNTNTTVTNARTGTILIPQYIFARNSSGVANSFSNARLAFYSIGESLDLALLDARVSALITAFGVAIP